MSFASPDQQKISTVYAEQVRQLYASMPAALVANLVTSLLLVAAQWSVIEQTVLVGWFIASLVVILARLLLLILYRQESVSGNKREIWGKWFTVGSSASAIMLGVAGIVLFPPGNALHQVLLAFVLVGMSAGAVANLSVGKLTFPLYQAFTLIPLIISLLIEGTQLSLILVPMVALAYLFVLKSSRTIYTNNAQNIELRIEAIQRQDELLLAQQKKMLHVMNTPLGVIEWTPDFTVTEWNPAAEKIFGYSREQVIGAYGPDLIVFDDDRQKIDETWSNLIHRKGVSDSINENKTANGRRITCEWYNTRLVNQNGEIIGIASTVQDISERKKAESEIFEAKNMLQAVLNTIPARVFWKDRNGVYLGCNAMFAADAGLLSPLDIIGHTDVEMPWKEQAQAYRDDDNDVINNGRSRIAYEEPLTLHDSRTVWVETSKIPLRNNYGVIYGVLGTYHDVTVRKLAVDEILSAKDEAEEANKAKSEFLSRMSHELRTPLNAILGFGQVLQLTGESFSTEQKVGVAHILKAGRHLLEMINEVLDISKIESGELKLEIEPVSLEEVIEEVCSIVQPEAKEKNLDIEVTGIVSQTIETDKKRLNQVLLNLVSNAVKYNRDKGKIKISVESEQTGKLLVKVSDTGIGIREEDWHCVFEPFGRVGGSTSSIEGTGIGLTITLKLVELMGAEIQFDSVYGEGSTFELEIPIKSPAL